MTTPSPARARAIDHSTRRPPLGCCVDRQCGKGCTEATCMHLPAGESCGTCVHTARCVAIFGMHAEDTACSFFPRRFRRAVRP